MEQKQFDEMMEGWLKRREAAAGDVHADFEWAVNAGITDGSRPESYATRKETALMIAAALRYWTRCVLRLLKAEADVC